jgi:hypothetical protein
MHRILLSPGEIHLVTMLLDSLFLMLPLRFVALNLDLTPFDHRIHARRRHTRQLPCRL